MCEIGRSKILHILGKLILVCVYKLLSFMYLNQILHDGLAIPLPFNLEILKWANETREVLKNARLPSQVKFYNIYATGLETPHTVW